MKTKLFCSFGMTLAAVLVIAAPAHAVLVNVDFNFGASPTYSGTGATGLAADVNGQTWNGLAVGATSVSGSSLLDSTGAGTSVGVSVTGIGTGNNVSAANALLTDYIQVFNAPPKPITITGLTIGGTYDLWLYATIGSAAPGYATKFNFGGVDKTSAAGVGTATAGNVPAGDENVTFVKYLGLIADGTGQIAGTVVFDNANFGELGIFNGFQIASVPEPSSILLIGLGLAGCMRFRRRRSVA